MSRLPSQAVIEAVEWAMREHQNLPGPMRHIFGDEVGDALEVLLAQEVQAAAPEVARAAEQAADERWMRWLIEHLHYGIDAFCEVDPPCTLAAYAALLLLDWLAGIELNANDIPDNPGALTVTRDSLGALHAHWLEFVYDDNGKRVIDEPNLTIVTRAREKSIDVTPPGWDEGVGAWDAHGWVYRLSFPVRHCVTCRCETVSDTTAQEDHE